MPLFARNSSVLKRVSQFAVLSCGFLLAAIEPAAAEGSRNLYPNNSGSRANLEWRTGLYANLLTRRTLLRVYVGPGEFLLLGSSAMGVQNPATGTSGNILVYNAADGTIGQETLAGAPTFSCADQRVATGNPTLGFIGSRAQELAGPNNIANPANGTPGGGVAGGYTPCYFQPPTPGIYAIVITGPSGLDADSETGPNGLVNTIQTDASQDTSVSAWDVTVRSNLAATTDIPGRLFTYYLTLFTGANDRPIQSTVYALTSDGFLYETNLNGIDPNGFVVYGNRVGYLNSDGNPLNRDIVATDDQLTTLQGGVAIARPEFPLFFNRPDAAAVSALNIPAPTIPVITAGSFRFAGTAGTNNSFVSTGGTFSYQANTPHVYELVISRDGTNFDPTNLQNRVLRGVQDAGNGSIAWNGLDNSGTPFPVGTNYQTRLIIRSGEYHFPLLDVENSILGNPSYRLINPPGGVCPPFTAPCVSAFYDDRGYQTANGTIVGPGVNVPLEPNPPGPDNSDFTIGFDTTSGQRRFANLFGDKKGLDLWTYYPSSPAITPLNIVESGDADLRIQKTVDRPATTAGQNATFTITLTNRGPSPASQVTVSDLLPPGLTFVSATPSQGTYDPATGVWNVGTIAPTTSLSLQITVTLTTSDPVRNVAQILNAQQRDPNPGDNQATSSLNVPNFRLVKRITAVTRGGSPIGFNNFVDDPGDANDTAAGWAQFPPVGIPSLSSTEPLQSGDEVEYTVYFLSDGGSSVLAGSLCDQVPLLTTLIPNSNQVQLGSASPVAGGTAFSPLAPLPVGNSCSNQANPNGSVIFDLGTVSATPGSNFGFVRFRVRIN